MSTTALDYGRGERPELIVVVAQEDGRVISQSHAAVRLMGDGIGTSCWGLISGVPGARTLPCRPGCVARLVRAGEARRGNNDATLCTSSHLISLAGDEYELHCIAINRGVVSVFNQITTPETPQEWERLTAREEEVLRWLAQGLNTVEIAEQLGISRATVRTHVEHMRDKLDVKNQVALVARGYVLGYLPSS